MSDTQRFTQQSEMATLFFGAVLGSTVTVLIPTPPGSSLWTQLAYPIFMLVVSIGWGLYDVYLHGKRSVDGTT